MELEVWISGLLRTPQKEPRAIKYCYEGHLTQAPEDVNPLVDD